MIKTCCICHDYFHDYNDVKKVLCNNCSAGDYPVKYKITVGVKPMAWKEKWTVIGTSGKGYTVAVREDGATWGCTCPAHKFQPAPKKDCQHILAKKLELSAIELKQPNTPKLNPTNDAKLQWMEYDVIKLLKAGEKILAIKYVRGITQWGLISAKDYVDKIQEQYVSEYNTVKSVYSSAYSPAFPTIESILGKKSEPKVFKEPTGRKFKELD